MGYNNIFSFTFPVKNNSSSISLVWNSIQFFVLISIYAKFYIIIHNQASAVFHKCLTFSLCHYDKSIFHSSSS